jgi:predicted RNA-binding Zn-ribbon protein involved in translation (DUF1610 family)
METRVPRPRVSEAIKRIKRQQRQARYRKKPAVRIRRREANRDYYAKNKEGIKASVRGRHELGGDPAKIAELRARYRIIGPHEPIPPDASLTTKNACGTKTNERGDSAYILESRWPKPDSPWGFVTSCPDLSTLLGLGGKGQNLDLKEFIRDEMLRRLPDRYPHREDLPTEEDVLQRHLGPPDIREREKRVREARLKQLTPEFQCPNEYCGYLGPMVPTGKGPYLAEKFTTEEKRAKMGVEPTDLLPGLYCPQCRTLVVFRPDIDVSQPLGGNEREFRCECGYKGPLSPDPATAEYNCPQCGLVVGMTLEDRPPSSEGDE